MKKHLQVAGLAIALVSGTAAATTVNTAMTVDDAFNFYISTNDTVLGQLVGSGSTWTQTYNFNPSLTAGVTNYLHVVGRDVYQVIAAFVGKFSLSDTSFKFANGTQHLLTNTADWRVSATGFGNNYTAPTSQYANGSGPWGTKADIPANARWIWSPDNCVSCTRYFSAEIKPVPIPAAVWLFSSALAGLGLMGKARSSRKSSV